jgi:group II intron reverse transcriptase/maturase
MSITMWSDIDWVKINTNITRIQKRIYQATIDNKIGTVHYLQGKLINSKYAKLLAVKQITQINKGRKTPGVDRAVIISSKEKYELALTLKISDFASPIRRVHIRKPGKTERRPLGISTIRDRSIQALVKLALEPQWEARFEPNSYGFRPGRSCHDAIKAVFNYNRGRHIHIFDADIHKCFDKINHDKLLQKLDTLPIIKFQIKAWLSAGIMKGFTRRNKDESLNPNKSETPQGGVISPLLANIALHGLEISINEHYNKTLLKNYQKETKSRPRIGVIRYADDFIIMHPSEKIIHNIKFYVIEWLMEECGLELSEEKSSITPSSQGYNFLGFHIISIKNGERAKCKIHISKKSKKSLLSKTREIFQRNRSASSGNLILKLNPLITGWCYYFRYCECTIDFQQVEYSIFSQLRAWVFRRHSKGLKSRMSIKLKYFPASKKITFNGKEHTGQWIFTGVTENVKGIKREIHLVYPSWINSEKYSKIRSNKSPYDGDDAYWSIRNPKYSSWSNRVSRCLKLQKGKCTLCGKLITTNDRPEIDHIKPISLGGKNTFDNLQAVHNHCHIKKSAYETTQRAQKSTNTT